MMALGGWEGVERKGGCGEEEGVWGWSGCRGKEMESGRGREGVWWRRGCGEERTKGEERKRGLWEVERVCEGGRVLGGGEGEEERGWRVGEEGRVMSGGENVGRMGWCGGERRVSGN